MTNKELKEKIAHLETELAEVKEMAEAMKRADGGDLFKPKDGQEYWFIPRGGQPIKDQWLNQQVDHNMYAMGNCFPTEQDAVDAVRALRLIQKARESQKGFVPDWKDMTQKYYLYFDSEESCIIGHIYRNTATALGFWGDATLCERFVRDNYDELIWFFSEYRG